MNGNNINMVNNNDCITFNIIKILRMDDYLWNCLDFSWITGNNKI